MRLLLTATLLTLAAAGPALGQSFVEEWQPEEGRDSIETIRCAACPPLAPDEDERMARDFKGGMISETQRIDGETMIVRTDNMMGGSPVTTVVSPELIFGGDYGKSPAFARVSGIPIVDHQATTASLDSTVELESFELRLN